MKEISSKITPYLKQSVTEFQNEARVHMLEAEELTVQLSANRGVGAKADGEAKGSGDGSEVGGGVISGGKAKMWIERWMPSCCAWVFLGAGSG